MTNDPKQISNVCGRFIAPVLAAFTALLLFFYGDNSNSLTRFSTVIVAALVTLGLCTFALPILGNAVNRWAVKRWRSQWVEKCIPGLCEVLTQDRNGLAVLRQAQPDTVGGRIARSILLNFCSLKTDQSGRSLYKEDDVCTNYQRAIVDELDRQVSFLRSRTLPTNSNSFFQHMNRCTAWLDSTSTVRIN